MGKWESIYIYHYKPPPAGPKAVAVMPTASECTGPSGDRVLNTYLGIIFFLILLTFRIAKYTFVEQTPFSIYLYL